MHVPPPPPQPRKANPTNWHTNYVYQGRFLVQRRVYPESTRILMEAASAVLTVSFTACIRFCALPTSISVASWSSSEPEKLVRRRSEVEERVNFTCSQNWTLGTIKCTSLQKRKKLKRTKALYYQMYFLKKKNLKRTKALSQNNPPKTHTHTNRKVCSRLLESLSSKLSP